MTTKLTVHSYNWEIESCENTHDHGTHIYSWCLDRESKPYLLRFEDFPTYAYLKLPLTHHGRYIQWTKLSITELVASINKKLKNKFKLSDHDPNPIRKHNVTLRQTFYYYKPADREKNPFVFLVFNNMKSMYECKKIVNGKFFKFKGKSYNFELLEMNIKPFYKMLTMRKCQMSQWFDVEGTKVSPDNKISKLDREYVVNWKTLNPIDHKTSSDWITHPGILSFDGEMYSDNHNALPDRTNSQHPCYMLSLVYQRYRLKETRRRFLIIMGETSGQTLRTKNVEVIKVDSETELCDALADLINRLDPEIITGYNIFGFDYPYLDARLSRKGRRWKNCSRLIGKQPKVNTNFWKSSGYGFNENNILDMPGRISLDMLPIVRRDYKLTKYNLDTVAHEFLKVGKHDVTPKQMFKIYERMNKALKRIRRIVTHVDEDGTWHFHHKISDWVIDQVLKDYKEALEDMEKVSDYCVQDSELVIDLIDVMDTWIALIELSSIVGVTPMETFTKGQQVRVLSLIYEMTSKSGYIIDQKKYSNQKFKGAVVTEPNPGIEDYVICLDFKSLYPSIIMAYNICHTTLIPPNLMDVIPDYMCHVFDWWEYPEDEDDDEDELGLEKDKPVTNTKKTRAVHHRYKFIKAEYDEVWVRPEDDSQNQFKPKRGILPALCKHLIDERNLVKKQMKQYPKGSVKYKILNERQKALKVSANSIYGALGTGEKGLIPLVEGAMCVTARGRELILWVNMYIIKHYPGSKVVYNDTDSTMIKLPEHLCNSNVQALEWGHKLEKEISVLLPDPLYLEFEKAGRMLCLKKKKYAYWLIDMETAKMTPQKKIMTKGIVLARRDNCQFQRDFYRQVMNKVINRRPMQETLDCIVEHVEKLRRGKVDWKDLVMIKGLGSAYKQENYFMNVFAQELRKIGKPAQPGDRLEFVIVKTRAEIEAGKSGTTIKVLLGKKMRLPETYTDHLGKSDEEPIDYEYYIEKLLMNIIEQLWRVGYKQELTDLVHRNDIQDHLRIINSVYPEYQAEVDMLIKMNNYRLDLVREALVKHPTNKLKNKAIMARRKWISGRDVADPRICHKPIKAMLKAIKKNKYLSAKQTSAPSSVPHEDKYLELIRNYISPALFKKLYPDAPPKKITFQLRRTKVQIPSHLDWRSLSPVPTILERDRQDPDLFLKDLNDVISKSNLFLTEQAYQNLKGVIKPQEILNFLMN